MARFSSSQLLCLVALLAFASAQATKQSQFMSGQYRPDVFTTTNPEFVYNASQLVNKELINLDYKADIYAGYLPVDDKGSYISYQLYPSNGANDASATLNNSDPLVLWM